MKKNLLKKLPLALLLLFTTASPALASPGGHGGGFFSNLGILTFILLILFALYLFFIQKDNAIPFLKNLIHMFNTNPNNEDDDENSEDILQLTYPAGRSEKVFQTGWMFGAKCIADGVDVSDEVQWSGSGTFRPAQGNRSRPSFGSVGGNTITLTYKNKEKTLTKTFNVNTVSPAGYAKVGDEATCPNDSHGCPGCPHPVVGPIISGSSVVTIDGKPAARKGDHGKHASCCGPNTFTISDVSGEVFINGRLAAKKGDVTKHCGGIGYIK